MNKVFLTALLALGLGLTSCTSLNSTNSNSNSLILKTTGRLLTQGATEAAVYNALKKVPESEGTFTEVQSILANLSQDNILTIKELKDVVKAQLLAVNSKYRTYSMLALDLVFAGFETNGKSEYDISEYREYIQALINGIDEGLYLYKASLK